MKPGDDRLAGSERLALISVDGHIGAPVAAYRHYLDPAHLGAGSSGTRAGQRGRVSSLTDQTEGRSPATPRYRAGVLTHCRLTNPRGSLS